MTLKTHKIPLEVTGQFSKLFIDYIQQTDSLRKFYAYAPQIGSFKQAIADRAGLSIDRDLLSDVIKKQYLSLKGPAETTITNSAIESLRDKNTFTVCTGHQLCLFTGPLYFIYKIISTINLAETLKKEYPQHHFVPVYWMASEDHDFEEISSVHVFGKKVHWNNPEATGAVGRLSTSSLNEILAEIKGILGESENAKELIDLFTMAYSGHSNVADATRYLVHALFGSYGLVIIDADDARLKEKFLPYIKDDISSNTNYKLVNSTIKELKSAGYEAQVNPREINVFELTPNNRVRIENASADVLNLPAGAYSPNVVLRPLYQQFILPNLAYVGGPGEIAYWLEYKEMFDHHNIMFPVLMPRNFAIQSDEKTEQQIQRAGLSTEDFFKEVELLIKEFVNKNAGSDLSLASEEEKLIPIYNAIAAKAMAVDPTLKGSVDAELQKTLNALKNIENKLIRSEKQKQETSINQIRKIKEKFFPEGILQERHDNFAPYYLKSGKEFISALKEAFDPFDFKMIILTN